MRLLAFVLGAAACFVALAAHGERRAAQKCLQVANDGDMMNAMYSTTDRLVLVPATTLDDLCELARLATDRLPEHDPLVPSLRGSIAATRQAALPEP